MSSSKFAIFCIVLVFFTRFHECANLEKASKPTCSNPHLLWCCSSNKQCRSSKLECKKVCIKGR
ncbi:unnamed protein product [Brassica rapa subsp. trilocularis]